VEIDWITVSAQIVNFLILVWLLRRFLYRPISEAMRRREARIEDRLSEAREARAEAEAEAERLREERADLEAARDRMLEEARAEAADLRATLEAELKDEMDRERAAWRHQLAGERDDFARGLQRRAARQVLDVAERVLREFADADLSQRIATTFVARLDSLDEDSRTRLAEAAGRAESATVETGRPLDQGTRGRVTRALHDALGRDLPVHYREDEEVLLGARLSVGEQTVEWSAARHLKRLDSALDETLDSLGRTGEAASSADAAAEEGSPA
jgi:F-type H+-transporting ATPase subunit b